MLTGKIHIHSIFPIKDCWKTWKIMRSRAQTSSCSMRKETRITISDSKIYQGRNHVGDHRQCGSVHKNIIRDTQQSKLATQNFSLPVNILDECSIQKLTVIHHLSYTVFKIFKRHFIKTSEK